MIAGVDFADNIWLLTDGIKEDREGSLYGISCWWTHIRTAHWTSL